MPRPFPRQSDTMSSEMHTLNGSHRLPASAMWQVDKSYANGKPKPKRPYTPYNLFYLLERELVVQKMNGPPKTNGVKRKHAGVAPREEDQIKPSSRYEGIIMAPYWYDPNMKEKRKHRKTHGMVSSKIASFLLLFLYHPYMKLTTLLLQMTDFVQGINRNHISQLGNC